MTQTTNPFCPSSNTTGISMSLLVNATTAYLGPLLKKHSAGEALIWEDLEASLQASQKVLEANPNPFVSKRIDELHQSLSNAYRDAAKQHLRQWVQSDAPLAPMEDADTQDSFVERCVNSLLSDKGPSVPNWHLDSAKAVMKMEMRKRARGTFQKYHPVEADASPTSGGEPPAQEQQQQQQQQPLPTVDEGAEDEEDGEMEEGEAATGDDAAAATTTKPSEASSAAATTEAAKKTTAAAATNAAAKKKKKPVVRKKGTVAKTQNSGPAGVRRGAPANRGGRKGGRGGGNSAKA